MICLGNLGLIVPRFVCKSKNFETKLTTINPRLLSKSCYYCNNNLTEYLLCLKISLWAKKISGIILREAETFLEQTIR